MGVRLPPLVPLLQAQVGTEEAKAETKRISEAWAQCSETELVVCEAEANAQQDLCERVSDDLNHTKDIHENKSALGKGWTKRLKQDLLAEALLECDTKMERAGLGISSSSSGLAPKLVNMTKPNADVVAWTKKTFAYDPQVSLSCHKCNIANRMLRQLVEHDNR